MLRQGVSVRLSLAGAEVLGRNGPSNIGSGPMRVSNGSASRKEDLLLAAYSLDVPLELFHPAGAQQQSAVGSPAAHSPRLLAKRLLREARRNYNNDTVCIRGGQKYTPGGPLPSAYGRSKPPQEAGPGGDAGPLRQQLRAFRADCQEEISRRRLDYLHQHLFGLDFSARPPAVSTNDPVTWDPPAIVPWRLLLLQPSERRLIWGVCALYAALLFAIRRQGTS